MPDGGEIIVKRAMAPADIAAVESLVGRAEACDGRPALDDHQRLELAAGGWPGFVGVEAHDPGGALVAYAHLSRGNQAWALELVVDPDHRARFVELGEAVMAPALAAARADGGGVVHWWAHEPDADHRALAGALGLELRRRLHQLRRPLPTGLPVAITTRPFAVGRDENAWLTANNRAFADHPEQGGWDLETLVAREREPWFDPAGFLLYEEDGRVLGFCWTKVHDDQDPALGEIYVIAVDPDMGGRGLGRELTLAGLGSLADRGITVGMLYVDADNRAAVSLYEKLGFTVHHTNHAFGTTL